MEVIKISDTKIVVILTNEDMTKYRISADELESFEEHTETALSRAVNEAADMAGMGRGDKFVQVFSSKEGGCEMFITGISANIPFEEKNSCLHTPSLYIYCFSDLENMLRACRGLMYSTWRGSSDAYVEIKETGKYYLMLSGEAENLCEFGAVLLNAKKGAVCFLSEHCRHLCSSAVETLGALA